MTYLEDQLRHDVTKNTIRVWDPRTTQIPALIGELDGYRIGRSGDREAILLRDTTGEKVALPLNYPGLIDAWVEANPQWGTRLGVSCTQSPDGRLNYTVRTDQTPQPV